MLRLAESTSYQMQHTVQQYLRHLTVHTIEPRWQAMEAALLKANDVDGVIAIHKAFIEKATAKLFKSADTEGCVIGFVAESVKESERSKGIGYHHY